MDARQKNLVLGGVFCYALFASMASVGAGSTQEQGRVKWWCSVSPLSSGGANSPVEISTLKVAANDLGRSPNAVAHIHVEGLLPHQDSYDEGIKAQDDWRIMRNAALAWRISGDRRYLQQVDDFLLAWADTYQPDFNPIDETNLDDLIYAYALTSEAISDEARDAAQRFLRSLGHGYIEQVRRIGGNLPGSNNNWQSHRVKLITMAAAALADRKMLDSAFDIYKRQIASNIASDGEVVDFQQRDALHYVVYDLLPLTQAAVAAEPYGDAGSWLRYVAPGGSSLSKALDWLLPFANGEVGHEEFVHSKVSFDEVRRKAGVSGLGGKWDPTSSRTLYWVAAKLDAKYQPLAVKLGAYPVNWVALCN